MESSKMSDPIPLDLTKEQTDTLVLSTIMDLLENQGIDENVLTELSGTDEEIIEQTTINLGDSYNKLLSLAIYKVIKSKLGE
jgi:DNA-binding ferritin-like protein (Dps family)